MGVLSRLKNLCQKLGEAKQGIFTALALALQSPTIQNFPKEKMLKNAM